MSKNSDENIIRKLAFLPLDLLFKDIYSKELDIEGIQRDVFIFRPRFTFYPGFAYFTGDIFLNEKLMKDGMEKARKYVFLHEEGHRRDKIIGKIGETAEAFISPPALILGFLIITASFLSHLEIIPFFRNPISLITYTLSFFAVMSFFSHLSEFRAEFFAIDKLGIEGFNQSRKNLREEWSYSHINQIMMLPAHPPKWLILKLYRLLK